MICFAGLGISGTDSIPLSVQKEISMADIVYLEQFTSPISKSELAKIKKMSNGEFILAKRWLVEDGNEILNKAKKKRVVLLTYGDPYIATTHIELRIRAIEKKIKTKTIHAASSITSMIGECGLHFYKIGRIATIMGEMKSLTTPYYVIYRNIIDGNHTVLLLEFNQAQNFFLEPNTAIKMLLEAENEQRRGVIKEDTFVIVASRIGFRDQQITGGKILNLIKQDFGKPPHSIIIPGNLHFTESDALKILAKCLDLPNDNSTNVKKISRQMIEKYVPMIRDAIKDIKAYYKDLKEFDEVFVNAELYIKDAEKFLEDGKDEVAILSIGYADGLIDALRIAKGLEPKM